MIYGYVRVSTREQNEDRQLRAMEEYGIKASNIVVDKQSGKDFDRKGYRKLMRCIRPGDVLVIKSIDRLGRNYEDVICQWRWITKEKNVDIVVLDMPILDTTRDKDLLGTLISDLVLQLLSYVAENERKTIRQRQAEGIAAAKERGVRFGRPAKYRAEDWVELYERFQQGEITQKEAMEIMGACQSTYYRVINEVKKMNKDC